MTILDEEQTQVAVYRTPKCVLLVHVCVCFLLCVDLSVLKITFVIKMPLLNNNRLVVYDNIHPFLKKSQHWSAWR